MNNGDCNIWQAVNLARALNITGIVSYEQDLLCINGLVDFIHEHKSLIIAKRDIKTENSELVGQHFSSADGYWEGNVLRHLQAGSVNVHRSDFLARIHSDQDEDDDENENMDDFDD